MVDMKRHVYDQDTNQQKILTETKGADYNEMDS